MNMQGLNDNSDISNDCSFPEYCRVLILCSEMKVSVIIKKMNLDTEQLWQVLLFQTSLVLLGRLQQ